MMRRNIKHTEIFDEGSGFNIPGKTVCILGSGPNPETEDAYKHIPKDAYIIAVNGAILIPDLCKDVWPKDRKIDMWMISDFNVVSEKWFYQAYEAHADIVRCFNLSVVDMAWKMFQFPGPYFSFRAKHLMKTNDVILKRGCLRPGTTVSGLAIQAICFFGKDVETIIFCGIDFGLDNYAGGAVNTRVAHGDVWKHLPVMNNLTSSLKDRFKFCTVSSTHISVPAIRGVKLPPKATPPIPKHAKDYTPKVADVEKMMEEVRKEKKDAKPNGDPETPTPTVGYITMAFLKSNFHHAICNTHDQQYPADKKQLHMLYQRNKNGVFPVHIAHDFPFEIIQSDVEGVWPLLYMIKLEEYLRNTTAEISLIWDEDDRYPPWYTFEAVKPFEDPKIMVSWTLENRFCKRSSFLVGNHDCPVGSMAIRTDFLRDRVAEIMKEFPGGYSASRGKKLSKVKNPSVENPKRLSGGALDNKMTTRIKKNFGNAIFYRLDNQLRTYVLHPEQNSVLKDASENITND